jgi:hypothetical protein
LLRHAPTLKLQRKRKQLREGEGSGKQITIVRVIVRFYFCQVLGLDSFLSLHKPNLAPIVNTGKGTYPNESFKSYVTGTDKLK